MKYSLIGCQQTYKLMSSLANKPQISLTETIRCHEIHGKQGNIFWTKFKTQLLQTDNSLALNDNKIQI